MEFLFKKKNSIPLISFLYIVIYLTLVALVIGFDYPYWTDEKHFYETILLFLEQPNLETLLHYEELNTPLPFILYAIWGKCTDASLTSFRFFSLIIAFFTFTTLYFLLTKIFPTRTLVPLLGVLAFSLIPYTPGLSFFIYTDFIALLFLLLTYFYYVKGNIGLVLLFSTAMLFCRQYLIFFTLSILLYEGFVYFFIEKDKRSLWMLFVSVISIGLLAGLFVFWNGLTPQNDIRKQFIGTSFSFHTNACIAYLCCFSIYTLPLQSFLLPSYIKTKRIVLSSFLLSSVYWLYPIKTSDSAINLGNHYIGFFHKYLSLFLNDNLLIGITFQLFLTLTFCFFFLSIQQEKEIKNPIISFPLLTTLVFLAIMPFSYLTWEKYCIPLIPTLYILLFNTKPLLKVEQKCKTLLNL